jgi:peptidoglycan/xylan/chitin deacetylase (PgdA/CDA1 family)
MNRTVTLPALRFFGNCFARSGHRAHLTVLIYHRVLLQADPMRPHEVDAETFAWQMGILSEHFNILPLHDAAIRLQAGSLPSRAACITFDDGYVDNLQIALPILQKHRLHATFFIATGFLEGGRMWNDSVIDALRQAPGPALNLSRLGLGNYHIRTLEERRRTARALISAFKYLPPKERERHAQAVVDVSSVSLPQDLMMQSGQVRALHRAGMAIGAHTVNHPVLTRLRTVEVQSEIADSKRQLETIIGEPVTLFAYPNGKPQLDYNAEHVGIVQALGFSAAVCTAWGTGTINTDVYQIPRFLPWDKTPLRFVMRLYQNHWRRPALVN